MLRALPSLRSNYARYGEAINTHDLAKFIALLLMTADHIGAYLYPDQLWWRVIGRFSAPIWFFLIGYAFSRRSDAQLWLGGIALLAVSALTWRPLFPANILWSMLACRFFLQWAQDRGWMEKYLPEIAVGCVMFALPSYYFFEYGSVGIMLAVMGWLLRREQKGRPHLLFYLACFMVYIAYQNIVFEFSLLQQISVALGTAITWLLLYRFKQREIKLPASAWGKLVKFLARNSLYYYVAHRALLQWLGMDSLPPEDRHLRWIAL